MSARRSTAMQRAKVATESIRKVEDSGRVGRACSVFPLVISAPEGIRTPNLLIRRHGRVPWSGRMRFALSCSSSCLDAGLSIRPIPLLHLIFKRPGSTGAGCAGWLGGPASSRDAALTARFVELRYYHRGAQYSDSGPRFRLRPLCCHRRTRLLTTANSPGGPAFVGRIRCWKGAPWQFLRAVRHSLVAQVL